MTNSDRNRESESEEEEGKGGGGRHQAVFGNTLEGKIPLPLIGNKLAIYGRCTTT